jgi:hypothetical protein
LFPSGMSGTEFLARFLLNGDARKVAGMRGTSVAGILSCERFQSEKVVLVQEVVSFGGIGRNEVVLWLKPAFVTKGAFPKRIDERTSVELHAEAVTASKCGDTFYDLVVGVILLGASESNIETGTKKVQPETVSGSQSIVERVVDE